MPQPGCWTQLSGPCLRWEAGGSPQEVPRRGPHWAAVSGAHSPVSPGRPGGSRPFALASPFPGPGLLSASTPLLSPLLSHSRQVSLSPVPDVPQGGRPPPRPQAAAGAGPACRHKSPGAASAESGGQAGPVNTRGPDGRGVPGPLQADLGGRPVLGHGSRQGRGRGRQSGPDPHGPRDPLGGWQQPKGPDSWQCRLAPGRGKVWPGAQQTRSTTAPSRHGAKRGTVGHPDAMSPELCPEVSSPCPPTAAASLPKGVSSTIRAGASQEHAPSRAAWGRPRQAPDPVLTLDPGPQKEAGGRAEQVGAGAHSQLNPSKWRELPVWPGDHPLNTHTYACATRLCSLRHTQPRVAPDGAGGEL